ncbi:phage tail protein X family protein [Campylobacter hyointestinalis subsp. lawsonii CCUG 27631]|uniref:tail protein X n=1 Tax=Campylobacter hyointestinalis TaxID=198 RepID=UPI0007C9817E|nr:tail protein X [Campylobacter hyointestinalis]ANE33769.1 phage tail protein X family protein [Campylobacter hyointestinalis subsp. lawsonii CCUG 27631]
MTGKVVAKDGDRLDSIVYRHYGNLEYFSQVLSVNFGLCVILKTGDVVILPEFTKTAPKQNKLW